MQGSTSEGIIDIYENVKSFSILNRGYAYTPNPYFRLGDGNIVNIPVVKELNGMWIKQIYARATGDKPIVIKLTY